MFSSKCTHSYLQKSVKYPTKCGCVADLIHSGALQHLDNIHIDWPLWLNVEENGTRLPDEKHAEFR